MNARVGGHERESVLPSLGDEQPVEGIAVMQRKACDGESMLRGQSEDADAGLKDVVVQIAAVEGGQRYGAATLDATISASLRQGWRMMRRPRRIQRYSR